MLTDYKNVRFFFVEVRMVATLFNNVTAYDDGYDGGLYGNNN
jgi:hypothetical protein